MRSISLSVAAASLVLGFAFTPGYAQTTTTPQTGSTVSPMTGQPGAMGRPGTGMTGAGTTGTGTTGTGAAGIGTGMTGTGMTGTGMTGTATSPNASTQTGMGNRAGSSNSAVNTSSANAPTPATGANSFSRGEARRRIAANGFTNVNVGSLKKDRNGVWRGKAEKDGQPVDVWLDYRGNVGQQ